MGQVIKEKPQGDPNQQRRSKPAVEDERQEAATGCGHDDHHEQRAGQSPFKKLVTTPQAALEEEILVIKKSRRDQPQRPKSRDDVIGIVLGVVDVGVVLQVNPREHWEAETEQQSGTVAHHRIPKAVGMGGVMAGVVNDRALEVQRQKADKNQ